MQHRSVTVRLDLSGLVRLQQLIRKACSSAAGSELDPMFEEWGELYLKMLHSRFDVFSKGGGNWRRLAASTIRSRRSRKVPGSRLSLILRVTDTLMNALVKGRPGNVCRRIAGGIEVGIGRGPHPSGVDTGVLAGYHQFGTRRIPKREVVVPPDRALSDLMLRRSSNHVARLLRACSLRGGHA